MFWLLACHSVSFSLSWMVLWDLCALSHPQVLFLLLRLFANVFEIFESVWDFWRVYFPKLQCYKMHQNGVVEISEDTISKANTNIYINMYPNICWADSLEICSKFFLISVCILQINLCKPPQPYHLTGGLTRLPVAQLNNSWVSSGTPKHGLRQCTRQGCLVHPAGLEFPGSDVELQWRSWNSELEFTHFSWNSWSEFASSPFEEDTYLVWSGSLLQDTSFVQSLDDQTTRFQYFLIVDLFHHHPGKLIVMPNHLSNSFQGKPTRNDTYLLQRQTMFIHT